jgi:hypothetical protein
MAEDLQRVHPEEVAIVAARQQVTSRFEYDQAIIVLIETIPGDVVAQRTAVLFQRFTTIIGSMRFYLL